MRLDREVSVNAENLSTDNFHAFLEIKSTATDLETLGAGPVCRSLVRGVMDSEKTLRSEDDSRCTLAGRTHAILAESPPPSLALRPTGIQSLEPRDQGISLVSEFSHASDQLGMGAWSVRRPYVGWTTRTSPNANPFYASCASSPTPSVPT